VGDKSKNAMKLISKIRTMISKCISVVSWISVCLLTSILSPAIGQEIRKVIPPSPNVAALGKYGEIPVSLYTGVPNISVPIYEVTNGDLALSVSLSYHAGGIKVEEIASSVGLGWSLNAGGIIGRSVRGLPDENYSWSSQPPSNTVEAIMARGDVEEIQQFADDVNNGMRDGEADIYYFNFGKYSGKFFYDQNGNPHTFPQKNFLIAPTTGGWKVTTEDGTDYFFTEVEEVSSAGCTDSAPVYTAWFLTKIESSDGKRVIMLTYEPAYYTYTTLGSQTKYIPFNGDASCLQNEPPCLVTQNYRTHRLRKIDFQYGYIDFEYENVRCDLVDDKSLDEIAIYSSSGELIRRFQLYHSYFGNSSVCDRPNEIYKRLKLDSVVESGLNGRKPAYEFSYNENIQLPSRLSYAQDHWGYYNGKIHNTDLVPSVSYISVEGHQTIAQGANRRVNVSTSQAGVLTRIVYPTGGETLFTYENNDTNDFRADPETVEDEISLLSNSVIDQSVYESQDVLVVPANGAIVKYFVQGEDCLSSNGTCDGDGWDCRIHVYKDNDPTPFRWINGYWDGVEEFWPEGTYKLKALIDCDLDTVKTFSVTINARIILTPPEGRKAVGGLRVARIEDRPQIGQPLIRTFEYTKESDPSASSGVLINFPNYMHDLSVEWIIRNEFGQPANNPIFCFYKAVTSFSNYPLATTSGSYVGYEHVIVKYGESGANGESRHTFVAYPDVAVPTFPFAPIENREWRRGALLRTKEFGRNDQGLFLIREVINGYQTSNDVGIFGIKTGKDELIKDTPELSYVPAKHSFYLTNAEFFELASTTEKTYDPDDDSRFVEKSTEYTYDPEHLQIVQTKTTTSRSDANVKEEIVVNRKFPFDYFFTGIPVGQEALGLKNLQENHVANAVVEEYTVKQNRNSLNAITNQRLISGYITTFKADNPYPAEIFTLEISSPLPADNFTGGSSLNNNSFEKNNLYRHRISFLDYDEKGNIVSQSKSNDVVYSYIWGYDKTFPIAQVGNVLPDVPESPTNFFYTSFEEDDQNTSTEAAYTGRRSHVGMYSIDGPAETGEYIISFWTKSGTDPWQYHENVVIVNSIPSQNISIGSTGVLLDEVRLYPRDAQMTTYTYDPLVGMTSMTDPNNITTYYEYDDLGRLMLIRDHVGNILKTYQYNYQQR
jgi:YD repeat-containing protein